MPPTVLVVDDSLTVRKIAERELLKAGLSVRTVSSGAEGIRVARETRPDLLLVDYLLPDMKGTDLCRSLAEDARTSQTPIIIVSGKESEALEQVFADMPSVRGCVEKPFSAQGLIAKVKAALSMGAAHSVGTVGTPQPAVQISPPTARPARVEPDSRKPIELTGPARSPFSAKSVAEQQVVKAPGPYQTESEKRAAESYRIGKIVDEILSVLEHPSEARQTLLRIIVRKYLATK